MEKTMTKQEMLWAATRAVGKGYSFEEMSYGDDLYGKEEFADEVGEYMTELQEIGRAAFYEKYKEFKLF